MWGNFYLLTHLTEIRVSPGAQWWALYSSDYGSVYQQDSMLYQPCIGWDSLSGPVTEGDLKVA